MAIATEKEKISKLGKQVKQTENWMVVKWPQCPIWWRQNNCNFANGTDWGIKFFTRNLFQTLYPNQTEKKTADKMVTEAEVGTENRDLLLSKHNARHWIAVFGKSKIALVCCLNKCPSASASAMHLEFLLCKSNQTFMTASMAFTLANVKYIYLRGC